MPTILRAGNVRVAVLTRNEHEPPDVHVEHPNGVIVVVLVEQAGFARLREASRHVKARDVRAVVDLVDAHFDELLAAWELHHR